MKYRISCMSYVYRDPGGTLDWAHVEKTIEAECDEEAVRIYDEAKKSRQFPDSDKEYSDFQGMVRIDQEELTTKII